MLTVAPNFDEDPDIQDALKAKGDPDSSILQLADLVPHAVWNRAEEHAACLPLYLSADLIDAPLEERVEAAARLLLGTRIPSPALPEAAARAVAIGEKHGLGDDADAGLVILASQAVWGRALFDTEFPDWVKDVLQRDCPAQRRVEMIRIALADAGGIVV